MLSQKTREILYRKSKDGNDLNKFALHKQNDEGGYPCTEYEIDAALPKGKVTALRKMVFLFFSLSPYSYLRRHKTLKTCP